MKDMKNQKADERDRAWSGVRETTCDEADWLGEMCMEEKMG